MSANNEMNPWGGALTDAQRIARLELLVCVLARGILAHEYSKDLCRGGTEEACKALANDQDLNAAMIALAKAT